MGLVSKSKFQNLQIGQFEDINVGDNGTIYSSSNFSCGVLIK